MPETERLIEIYKQLEDAGLMVIAGKKDTAELMVSRDVVPVVRCKKCRYYNPDGEYCGFWGACRHPEHYCGEGDPECGK